MKKIRNMALLFGVLLLVVLLTGCECEHEYGAWTVAKAATCTEEGVERQSCTKCGEAQERTIARTEHTYGDWVTTKEATCTEPGVAVKTCSGCGATQETSTLRTDHTYGEWKVTKDATCASSGTQTRTCTECDNSEQKTIVKKEHSYGDWKTTQKATCAKTGTKTKTCSECGATQQQTISKTDHDYGSWKTTKKATCIEPGTKTRTCSVCGKAETQTISKTDHDYGSWKTTKKATCTEPGTKTRTCSVCGKAETQTIEAGHDWNEALVRECSDCGVINGNDCENLILSDFRSILRDYPSATGQCAYALTYSSTTTTDSSSKTEMFVMVVIRYKIQTNWDFVKLYNITEGTSIENPVEYYQKKADQSYGVTRINYLSKATSVQSSYVETLEYMMKSLGNGAGYGPGLFLSANDLNKYK